MSASGHTRGVSGLLTTDVTAYADRLPLSLPAWARHVVADAIALAWSELLRRAEAGNRDVATMSEPEITAALQDILNGLRIDPSPSCPAFSGQMFQHVVRDASEISFDGQSLEKAPDLAFREVALSTGAIGGHEATLFAEAKIVDRRSHPVRLYCGEGIARFVRGEYAWSMDCGMMLAYARDGVDAATTLTPLLQQGGRYSTVSSLTNAPWPKCVTGHDLFSSVHQRDWTHSDGWEPGDIELLHLWLD